MLGFRQKRCKLLGDVGMSLTLMYITNHPVIAGIAQDAGVDRIWIDLEYIGKEARQPGMNTVKSNHTLEDISTLRPLITKSDLMVRVNPLHDSVDGYISSEEEIDRVIEYGADVIMLPMFKTRQEAERFVRIVDGRAKTNLLVETAEAAQQIDEILKIEGVDEIHVGLNDLHLAFGKKFMFQLLSDGTVAQLCDACRRRGIKYGFGGIARVGYGMLPAEYIIAEHYALGSTAAILSRGFCDANIVKDPRDVAEIFIDGVRNIRRKEREVAGFSEEQFLENRKILVEKVNEIVRNK